MPAYLSARAAAKVCGVSERTIRNWVHVGKLSAEKSDGTFRIARDRLEQCVTESARTSAAAERNGADPATSDSSVISVELVRLLAKLQEENRVMAGRIGWLEAQVEHLKALPAAPTMPEIAPQRDFEATTAEPTQTPAETPKARPWWRLW